MRQLLTEIKLWSLAWGLAGLIAGGSLGALLSGGNYLPWIVGGALPGAILAGFVGGMIALFFELIWKVLGRQNDTHSNKVSQ